jgi:hypothetical protein
MWTRFLVIGFAATLTACTSRESDDSGDGGTGSGTDGGGSATTGDDGGASSSSGTGGGTGGSSSGTGSSGGTGSSSGTGTGGGTATGDTGTPEGCPDGQEWAEPGCTPAPSDEHASPPGGCYFYCDGPNDACPEGTCQLAWIDDMCPCPPWSGECCEGCGGGEAWLCLE